MMPGVEEKAYAIRDLHRILDGPAMTHAQALYHAFKYASGMKLWLLEMASSIRSTKAHLTPHLTQQLPVLVRALQDLAEHARAFGASPQIDALLYELKAGSPSETSLGALDDFIYRATSAEAQLAAAKPSAVWLAPDQAAPKPVFDLFEGPYLAAMDYIQFFGHDVNELRDRLREAE